ncbi:MAG: ribulose-phosphate 3-epimerase [Bacteroidetes bacterium]|jgi:ribulose-phosphate 3-epimerase|nr:ribulose-phosphate 3-epimerase [Bacteroidota bacterium]MBL0015696.1 ribulose-phosphate 3-epimerase [Bacteroidota bacterium]MBP6721293.1 ribulose-phosphate 3-epimerase [Bacteroidia bacterium]MBP8073620.1 ribulose-phosphate 3-epimerase [Bacteroidia bacterium]
MNRIVSPSVLSADFANLERDIKMLNDSACDWIHCDIMDGVFVPNISFGLPVLSAIKRHATKPLDVHLMIADPGRYVKDFKEAGADMLTVHFEGAIHLHRLLGQIRDAGMHAGLALNPGTSIDLIHDVIDLVDLVLVMSVNPGFGGQKFIESTYSKVIHLSQMRKQTNARFLIEVDGGVNASNTARLYEAGADALVAGNYVFGSGDPKATIQTMKTIGVDQFA